MLCAIIGDLEGLLDLFSRGLASHQDCTIDGKTLFHVCPITVLSGLNTSVDQVKVACENSQTHIVQCLIDMNLDRMRDDITAAEASLILYSDQLSMDIIQPLVSRGLFDALSHAAQDLKVLLDHIPRDDATVSSILCLAQAANKQDVLELYLRTCFPFWHTLQPRGKQRILGLIPSATDWTVDSVRFLIFPSGSVQSIEMRTWIDDGVSLLHTVLYLYFCSCPGDATKGWRALLQEIIDATDDLHLMLEPLDPFKIAGVCSALKSALVLTLGHNILAYGRRSPGDTGARRKLKQLTANLQSLMQLIASCGHDLLGFGRREAAIWVGEDAMCRIAKEALIFEPSDIFRIPYGRWCVWVIHYGSEPLDWYFEWEIPQEDYAGEFWALVERGPPTPMPGAWVDED